MYSVYYIPSGPKNLTLLFPTIDWNNVVDYVVGTQDANGDTLCETPLFKIGCCCDERRIRLFFFNYDGSFDAINFKMPKVTYDVTSASYQKGLQYPLIRRDTGLERFDINANDTYEAINTCYGEKDRNWLQQCISSPKAFMQWDGIEGQGDGYIPVTILDSSFPKVSIDAFNYVFSIKFKLANSFFIQRN